MPHISKLFKESATRYNTSLSWDNVPTNGLDLQDKTCHLPIRKNITSERSPWEQAWELAKKEAKWTPPLEWGFDKLDLETEVRKVHDKAQDGARQTQNAETLIPGTHTPIRQVFGDIAGYATQFQAIGGLVTTAVPQAAIPWALISLAISTSFGESETYNSMLECSAIVSKLLPQYSVIEQTYCHIESELTKKMRATMLDLYVVILLFEIRAIKYFEPNHKLRRTFLGTNPFSANAYQHQKETINEARRQLDQDIALVHYDVTKRGIEGLTEGQNRLLGTQKENLDVTMAGILALADNIGASLRSVGETLERAEARQQQRHEMIIELWKEPLEAMNAHLEEKHIERVKKWVSNLKEDPEDNHEEIKAKRQLPLGEWLFKHQTFDAWARSNESSILWLYGFAGTGKTGLVRRVIDAARDQPSDRRSGRIGFFYCTSDKAGINREESSPRADPGEVLRSIVSQVSISQQDRSVATIVEEKYRAFGPQSDRPRKLNNDDCVDILLAISTESPISIFLDAFDECDRQKSYELVLHLKNVLEHSPGRVKVFISTRSIPAIDRDLSEDPAIEVTVENNHEDVHTFIKTALQKRIADQSLLRGKVSPELQEEIESELTSRAHNMFLYASLLLSQLCDRNRSNDEESIRKKLKQLPRSLPDVYNRILEEIHDSNNSPRSCLIAQNTFKWILGAQEPLPRDPILEAISPPDRKANLHEVLEACRTLVVPKRTANDDIFLEFAHYSVQEHLSTMDEYSKSQCNLMVAQSCLRTLVAASRSDQVTNGRPESSILFHRYALLYWPLHYEGISKDDMLNHRSEINTMLRTFLLPHHSGKDEYADWLSQAQKLAKDSKSNKDLVSKLNDLEADPPTALFAACVFGLEDIIGKFGRELGGLNKCNSQGQNALGLAIKNNKLEVVKALLSRRYPADLNLLNVEAVKQFEDMEMSTKPIIYASALQCAAAEGHLEITEFLIMQGAHVDLVAGYYGNALQAAAFKGHDSIVSLLLKSGAEPNSQGGYHGNALQAAAAAGHSNIVDLLLENKPPALVDTPGGHYGSALMAALCSGCSATIWALLDDRPNLNARSRKHGLPLQKAASMGHAYKGVVASLVARKAGADFSTKENKLHLLHQAALYDMLDLAQYCLKNGCKLEMITTEGPRYHRRFGDFQHEMTPLAFACAEGHVNMVGFLLDSGAHFGHDKDGSAVLWTAAYQGHAEVVKLLLERFKAKHNDNQLAQFLKQRPSGSGHGILFAAASSGNAEVVPILLNDGVLYESNWYGATPLLATATFRCSSVTEALLGHERKEIRASINEQARNGRTALIEACALNEQEVAKLLLSAGADVSTRDKEGDTALHHASHHEDINLVTMLIDNALKSSDRSQFQTFLDSRNNGGRTALLVGAEWNRLPCIHLLLNHGADYTIQGGAGRTPLHWASRGGHAEAVGILLEKAKEDHGEESQAFKEFRDLQNNDGQTALLEAAENNRELVVRDLLASGADCTIGKKNGSTSLHEASWRGHMEIVKHILNQSQETQNRDGFREFLNRRNDAGKTALMDAAHSGRPNIVDLLLQHGADYSLGDKDDFTALHYCAFRHHVECVQKILRAASQDNTDSGEKFEKFLNQRSTTNVVTALMDAAHTGDVKIVDLLLQHGADYSLGDRDDFTALHYCAFRNHLACVQRILETASADTAASGDKFKMFLNQQSKSNKASALHDATRQGLREVVEVLLAHEADCYSFDRGLRTPLHCAVETGKTEIFVALLKSAKKNMDVDTATKWVNSKDEKGNTVWAGATRRGHAEMMRSIRECGLKIEGI